MTNRHSGNTNGTNGFRPQAPLHDPAAPAAQINHRYQDTARPIRSIQQLDGRWVVTDRLARGFASTPETRTEPVRAR